MFIIEYDRRSREVCKRVIIGVMEVITELEMKPISVPEQILVRWMKKGWRKFLEAEQNIGD